MTGDTVEGLLAITASLRERVATLEKELHEARHLAHEQHIRLELLRQIVAGKTPAWAAGVKVHRVPANRLTLPPALPPLAEEPGA